MDKVFVESADIAGKHTLKQYKEIYYEKINRSIY